MKNFKMIVAVLVMVMMVANVNASPFMSAGTTTVEGTVVTQTFFPMAGEVGQTVDLYVCVFEAQTCWNGSEWEVALPRPIAVSNAVLTEETSVSFDIQGLSGKNKFNISWDYTDYQVYVGYGKVVLSWDNSYDFMMDFGTYFGSVIPSELDTVWYPDFDGDGWGAEDGWVSSDVQPYGYVEIRTMSSSGLAGTIVSYRFDCDDTNSSVYPGAPVSLSWDDGIDYTCSGGYNSYIVMEDDLSIPLTNMEYGGVYFGMTLEYDEVTGLWKGDANNITLNNGPQDVQIPYLINGKQVGFQERTPDLIPVKSDLSFNVYAVDVEVLGMTPVDISFELEDLSIASIKSLRSGNTAKVASTNASNIYWKATFTQR